MFERFTERARQVVVLAQEEARNLKHNYIGAEHILLGLLREEDGLAAHMLESLGISVEPVRAHVVGIVGFGEEGTSGQIPFTPQAKRVLELSMREALSLGHNHIGTEHILLGLVREHEGVAARILLDFDADSERIRSEVIRMLSVPGRRQQSSVQRRQSRAARASLRRYVQEPTARPSDVDLGWRGRPITLAALGAAVLARLAFDPSKTLDLEPLEMQVLARLAVGPPDEAPAPPGELVESLTVALACDRDDLHVAVRVLTDDRLVNYYEEQDGDRRVTITTEGLAAVQAWLARTAPLFGATG